MRPGEGVEDGFGAVAVALGQLAALGDEPLPMGVGLQDAEAVVVGKTENLNEIARPDGGRGKDEDRALGNVGAAEVTRQRLDDR